MTTRDTQDAQNAQYAVPGMTYHQYLVGQIAGRYVPQQDMLNPVVRTAAEHAARFAFAAADAICAEYDRRAKEATQQVPPTSPRNNP